MSNHLRLKVAYIENYSQEVVLGRKEVQKYKTTRSSGLPLKGVVTCHPSKEVTDIHPSLMDRTSPFTFKVLQPNLLKEMEVKRRGERGIGRV